MQVEVRKVKISEVKREFHLHQWSGMILERTEGVFLIANLISSIIGASLFYHLTDATLLVW